MVAVSKDLRFDKEEKYNVWAVAVGSIPNPTSGRILSILIGNVRVLLVADNPKTPMIIAVKR
jgi:hypothetical protein